jgi:AmmeMemoRadiSam system protein B/AmmeMemoRadiSam system protein A
MNMNNIFGKVIVTPSDKRKPSFAGSWYEADTKKLRPQLSDFLKAADETLKLHPFDESFSGNKPVTGNILAAIAPHAGYTFSGSTAGYVYESLKMRKITRVFLLGPSHYAPLHGCALPVEKIFATPVGDLRVDTRVVNELKDFPLFKLSPDIHKHEHSLEMQLPFIRQALGDVTIVPVIVGSLHDEEEMRLVGSMLSRFLKNGDLVLVSSDFTHYGPRYDFTPFTENITKQVKELDQSAFQCLHNVDLPAFIEFRERTRDTICGYYPCAVLLSMLPPESHATLLSYKTSRDIVDTGDDNSVSYLAIVFSNNAESDDVWQVQKHAEECSSPLTADEQKALLTLARSALVDYVTDRKLTDVADIVKRYPRLGKPAGAFVTLYRKPVSKDAHDLHKELRGCIGYIWPVKSLAQAVVDNAVGASSKDPRFSPVDVSELGNLQIDINVLTPPNSVESYKDIKLGNDGVIFYKNQRQAVFLPSVATEFGWTLEEMLAQLSIKAGFNRDGWQSGARFDVFQAQSFEETRSAN